MESSDRVISVSLALKRIARTESGRQACVNAGAVGALAALAQERTVIDNELAFASVKVAFQSIYREDEH